MKAGGWTVAQVARMSGVSVRTLHHYDEVGLLKPACVGANGYRYYGREELLRLQQILFHRELGLSLETIAAVLDAAAFDKAAALRAHRLTLEADIRRRRRLIRTIEETLASLEGETTMTPKAMYRGFDPKVQEAHAAELVDRFGPEIQVQFDAVKAAMETWTQADYDAAAQEREAIEAGMAKALTDGLAPDCEPVKALMRRHHAWITLHWAREAGPLGFAGLGQMYVDDPRFAANYDERARGLAEYMAAAMSDFARTELAGRPG